MVQCDFNESCKSRRCDYTIKMKRKDLLCSRPIYLDCAGTKDDFLRPGKDGHLPSRTCNNSILACKPTTRFDVRHARRCGRPDEYLCYYILADLDIRELIDSGKEEKKWKGR